MRCLDSLSEIKGHFVTDVKEDTMYFVACRQANEIMIVTEIFNDGIGTSFKGETLVAQCDHSLDFQTSWNFDVSGLSKIPYDEGIAEFCFYELPKSEFPEYYL